MKPEYVSLLSGLIGALVGAAASILTMWVQQRFQSKRDNARLASEIALKEFEHALQQSQAFSKAGHEVEIAPVTVYIAHHAKLLELILQGELTPKAVRDLDEYTRGITNAMKKLWEEEEQKQ